MVRYLSPSKVNLFLQVLNKRTDGYHELKSLFQAIGLFDFLDIQLHTHDHFTCSDPSLPTDERNLVVRARQLFRKKTGLQTPLFIHLEKHIPHEAGLGGGSGNAATVLFALNQLTRASISEEELAEWSSELGSDVPFFFSTGRALCQGRGERVTNMEEWEGEGKRVWIVKPPIGLSTPRVYSALKKEKREGGGEERLYENDLEDAALELCPELGELKKRLEARGFDAVFLCGSGTSFCCVGEGAEVIAMEKEGWGVKLYQVPYLRREKGHWWI